MGHKEHYISVEIDTNLFRVCPTCWGSGISKKAPPDDDCYELTMNKTNYIKLKYPVPSQVSSFISTKKNNTDQNTVQLYHESNNKNTIHITTRKN